MSGVKGKSGRKRVSKNREDAMRSLTNKLPMAIDVLTETADGSNKDRLRYEAAIEIKDSVMGKPKQQSEVELKGGEGIGVNTLKLLIEGMAQRRLELEGKLIEGGKGGQDSEG